MMHERVKQLTGIMKEILNLTSKWYLRKLDHFPGEKLALQLLRKTESFLTPISPVWMMKITLPGTYTLRYINSAKVWYAI